MNRFLVVLFLVASALWLATPASAHSSCQHHQNIVASLEEGHLVEPVLPLCKPGRRAVAPPDHEEIEEIIERYFSDHPVTTAEAAKAVAWCESRYNSAGKNPTSTAGGLFQFLAGTWRWEANYFGFPTDPAHRYDPEMSSALAALVVARDGGWRQWVCKP